MDITTILIFALILVVLGSTALLAYLFLKSKNQPQDEKSLLLIQNQINQVQQALDKQLQSQRESLQKQSISQQQLIQDINARSQKTIGAQTTLVLSPKSEFFRFFEGSEPEPAGEGTPAQ